MYSYAFRYKTRKDDLICMYVDSVTITSGNESVTVSGEDIGSYVYPTNADYVLEGNGYRHFASKEFLIMVQVSEQ